MYRIIIDTTLLKSEATVTSSSCTWENVSGVLPPSEKTSENPEDYVFVLNGVEYPCNYYLHGDTKYKASYKTNGHDTIMLEYIIATGKANIKIRTDDVFEVLDSNTFELRETIPDTSDNKLFVLYADENNSAIATFDGSNWTIEKVGE